MQMPFYMSVASLRLTKAARKHLSLHFIPLEPIFVIIPSYFFAIIKK